VLLNGHVIGKLRVQDVHMKSISDYSWVILIAEHALVRERGGSKYIYTIVSCVCQSAPVWDCIRNKNFESLMSDQLKEFMWIMRASLLQMR
jgi:hypothetical protein